MNNFKGIQEICKSIKSSLNNENYFAAIFTSLILIDICSKIYSPKELLLIKMLGAICLVL